MREDQSSEGGAAGTSHSDLPGTGSEYPRSDPKVCVAKGAKSNALGDASAALILYTAATHNKKLCL